MINVRHTIKQYDLGDNLGWVVRIGLNEEVHLSRDMNERIIE